MSRKRPRDPELIRPAIYARVSTEEQRDRQTIEAQVAELQRHVTGCGFVDVPEYLDDGVSGATYSLPERPAGARLLADARAGRVNRVYVRDLKRVGRNAREILNTVHALEQAGCGVVSLNEHFDTTTPTGRFMLTAMAAVAELDRENFLEITTAAVFHRAREGAWFGPVPYGYRKDGAKSAARLVPSEELIPGHPLSEADVVRLVYSRIATDHWSCYRVADELNERRIPTYYGREGRRVMHGRSGQLTANVWTGARIRNLVTSTVYRGEHSYGVRSTRREPVVREVPALVSADLWHQAQEQLVKNQRWPSRRTGHQYLLRGLIRCAHCGLTYCGSTWRPSPEGIVRYYACSGSIRDRSPELQTGARCRSRMLNSTLDEIVWSELVELISHPNETLHELVQELAQAPEDQAERAAALVTRLDAALLEVAAERERTLTAFRRGWISEDEASRSLADLDLQAARLTRERDVAALDAVRGPRLEAQMDAVHGALAEIRDVLRDDPSFDVRRQVVELLVVGIRAETIQCGPRHREALLTVTYRLDAPRSGTDMHRSERITVPEPSLVLRRIHRTRRGGWD